MEKLHIQPSEIDLMPYYEYEFTISIYNDLIKDRKSEEDQTYDKERDKYNMDGMKGQMKKFGNPSSLGSSLSKLRTPSTPSIKVPKF
jgi:hypothetical protein